LLSVAGAQPSEEMLRLRELYEQGLRSYAAQDWDSAESSFRECVLLRPNDGPSLVLLDRIQQLRRNPPGNDWKGVWQLEEK
jgi:adenylate cyclase